MTACGLCSIDKDVHGTIDYHGIVHIWTEPWEQPEPDNKGYDFVVDYLPLAFAYLVALFIIIAFVPHGS